MFVPRLVQDNPEVAMDSIVHMTQIMSAAQKAEVIQLLQWPLYWPPLTSARIPGSYSSCCSRVRCVGLSLQRVAVRDSHIIYRVIMLVQIEQSVY